MEGGKQEEEEKVCRMKREHPEIQAVEMRQSMQPLLQLTASGV